MKLGEYYAQPLWIRGSPLGCASTRANIFGFTPLMLEGESTVSIVQQDATIVPASPHGREITVQEYPLDYLIRVSLKARRQRACTANVF